MMLNRRELGSGINGRTVVLFAGWPDRACDLYSEQIPALIANGCKIIALDLPGYELESNDSTFPLFGYNIFEVKDMLRATLEDINKKQQTSSATRLLPVLVVHDWAAVVASLLFNEYRDGSQKLVSRVCYMDISPSIDQPKPLEALGIVAYQLVLASIFFACEVVLRYIVPQSLRDLPTRAVATVFRAKGAPSATSRMNYMYLRYWVSLLTGAPVRAPSAQRSKGPASDAFPEYTKSTPVLFFWGKNKPFFFHSQRFIDFVATKADDGLSATVAVNAGHWFMTGTTKHDVTERLIEFVTK